MLLLALLLIPAVIANKEADASTRNNHILEIDGDILFSVKPTPTSSLELDLSGLGLRILADDAFETLATLKKLDLGNNSLSSIPKQLFSNLKNLEHLSLANNNLTDFEKVFEGLDHLKTLNISYNPLTELKATALFGLPRTSVVFTKGTPLKIINAFVFEKEPGTFYRRSEFYKRLISNDKNPIRQAEKQYDVVIMEGWKRHDMNNNHLIKICIDGPVLKRVEHLTENGTLLPTVFFNDNLLCLQRKLKDPYTLDLKNLGIARFEKNWYGLGNTTPIIRIRFAENNIARVTPELLNDLPVNVRIIDLSSNQIEQLEKGVLKNAHIRVMDLRSNVIHKIEDDAFAKLPRLRDLHISDNLLDNTRFMATLPRKIRMLLVQRNIINEISPLSFSTLNGLSLLFLDGNRIQELKSNSLYGLDYLMKLDLSDNLILKIEPESFQQVTAIQSIALNNNKIVSFENGTFDNLPNLKTLHVSYNKLSAIEKSFPNGVPPNLNILNLGFNEIEKLESDNFKNLPLTSLVLSGNKISEIEHGALELPVLRELFLDSNRLTQLDIDSFRGLNNIESLELSDNSITIIPKGFTTNMDRLTALDLSHNPIHRLQNGALYDFRKTADSKVYLKNIPIEIIERGLFDDM